MSEALRKAALLAIGTIGYYASVCGEDEQDTPAKQTQAVLRAALAEPDLTVQEPVPSDGWLQDGALLYRLTDERKPQNRDEINVTMADGSRSEASRTRRAGELLDRIRANKTRREAA